MAKKKKQSKTPFMIVTDQNEFVSGNVLKSYASDQGSKQLDDPFNDKYGEMNLVSPLYNPTSLMGISEINVYHDISCDVKSQDIAGIGWKLEPIGDNPSDKNKEILETFFNRVFIDNPFTKAQRDKEELGYCSVELVRVNGSETSEPYNLFHVPAHTIRIHKEHNKFCQTRSGKYVWFKRVGTPGVLNCKTGEEINQESNPEDIATEILWNVAYTSKSSYYGRPKIIPALRAVYGHLSSLNYNISFFKNYGVPAYAVFVSGNYEDGPVDESNPNGETKLQKAVREKFRQVQENPHSTMVFSVPSDGAEGKVDIKFEKLSVDTKEGSFRLYRQDNRDEVITAHRVDPHRIGINQSGPLGGDTAIISRQNYKETVQRPEQEVWENLINQQIIAGDSGFNISDWRFRFVSFNLEDEISEFNLVKGLFGIGGMTPNEVIRKYSERFGLVESNDESMNLHYIGSVPIESGFVQESDPVVPKMLDALADDIEEAIKNDADRNTSGIFSSFKKFTQRSK